VKILLIDGRSSVYTHGFVPVVQRAEPTSSIPFFSANRDLSDPLAPRREAAMFYGLFLRGHNVESLRRDIDVPSELLKKWLHGRQYDDQSFRDNLKQLYQYRKQVLAIFDQLVLNEPNRSRVQ
jgi:hypothetical protein